MNPNGCLRKNRDQEGKDMNFRQKVGIVRVWEDREQMLKNRWNGKKRDLLKPSHLLGAVYPKNL